MNLYQYQRIFLISSAWLERSKHKAGLSKGRAEIPRRGEWKGLDLAFEKSGAGFQRGSLATDAHPVNQWLSFGPPEVRSRCKNQGI